MEKDLVQLKKTEEMRTNFMVIQQMSTEELACFLSYFSTCDHCMYKEEDCMKKIRNKEIDCQRGIALWLDSIETHEK